MELAAFEGGEARDSRANAERCQREKNETRMHSRFCADPVCTCNDTVRMI